MSTGDYLRDEDYEDFPGHGPRPGSGSGGTGLGLSIAGFAVGVLSLPLSFLPCIGAIALWPAVTAVVLSGVGLFLSLQAKNSTGLGLGIAGLVVSLLAAGFAGYERLRVDDIRDGWKQQPQTSPGNKEAPAEREQNDDPRLPR